MTKYSTLDQIDYVLKKNRGQRSMRMHIDPKGRLVVSCNTLVSDREVENFVINNRNWIDKHLNMLKPYNYQTGEIVPFWGLDYQLVVKEGKKSVRTENTNLVVTIKDVQDSEKIRKALYDYYRRNLETFVPVRISYWCRLLCVSEPTWSVNNSKTKWGVCYCNRKEIKISAMTACLEEKLIDMTILHELCHLKHPDHSKAFWDEVKSLMPDIDQRKEMMRNVDRTRAIHSLF